ncbi:MAG: T9SS type A sorting domain-containing protein [Bacteroidetes bacterium]|nr:MAG: T9SS type A sorting domain-containing protein [Bacteroidota bacterium]
MLIVQFRSFFYVLVVTLMCCNHLIMFAATIPDALQKKLVLLRRGETLPVIVKFSQRPNFSQSKRNRKSAPEVIRHLRSISSESITKLNAVLEKQGYKGRMIPLWITNSIVIEVTKAVADTLAQLPFVESVIEDERIALQGEAFADVAPYKPEGYNPGWNIGKIRVDSVWMQYGIKGSCIVIGSMDTGVDTAHPSIATKWKRGSRAWFDAISGKSNPYDDDGHGTHTSGTLVGGDGPGPDTNDIGIAYGAKLIAAKMLTSGFSTISQVTAAAQWMLDPDSNSATNDFPQVINNSWFSNTRGSTWFADAAAAWRAAGIIPVFCAANFGPTTSSTRSPGDYATCISVGGTNLSDNRYSSTSVGPSPAGSPFPSDRRKPDVSAPGEGVRSAKRGGGFTNSSGTSMATPHVTGTIALMLQANPTLTYDEVFDILKTTSVDLGDTGYDYVFGYGRIDALNAVREALRRRIEVIPVGTPATSETGDSALISVSLRVSPLFPVKISFSLSDTTEGVIASGGELEFLPGNWDIAQAVLVRGLPDSVEDGNVTYSLIAETRSEDTLYNNITARVTMLTNDNATIASIGEGSSTPQKIVLYQNYPNPFNPATDVRYEIRGVSYVTLKVFDVLGREVATLVDEFQASGFKSQVWDASGLPGGVYYYQLRAESIEQGGRFMETKKMLLLR